MATRQKDDSSSPQPDVLHLAAAVGEQRLEARARTARRCARAWRPLEVGGERWSQYSHGLCCAVCAHAFRRRDTVPTCGCPSSTIGLRRHRARSIHTCWRRTIALRSAAPDLECRAQRLAAPRYLPQSSFQEVKILGPRNLPVSPQTSASSSSFRLARPAVRQRFHVRNHTFRLHLRLPARWPAMGRGSHFRRGRRRRWWSTEGMGGRGWSWPWPVLVTVERTSNRHRRGSRQCRAARC